MFHDHLFRSTVLAATLLVATGPVSAESWIGLAAGSSESDEFCDLFGSGVDCDDEDTGVKAFIGVQPIPQIGIEAFWVDLGEARATGPFGNRFDVSADGIGVALLPTIPVSRTFELYARLGYFAWEADTDLRVAGGSVRDSDDGSDAVYGLGARLLLSDTFGLRGEWEQYELDDEEVSLLSVGAEFRF